MLEPAWPACGPDPEFVENDEFVEIVEFVENSKPVIATRILEYMIIQRGSCICLVLNNSKLLLTRMPLCRDKQQHFHKIVMVFHKLICGKSLNLWKIFKRTNRLVNIHALKHECTIVLNDL